MFFFLFLLYYISFSLFKLLLYLLYNLLVKIDYILFYFYSLLESYIKNNNLFSFLFFISIYFFFFTLTVSIYLLTKISFSIYYLLDFKLRFSLLIVKEISFLLIFWYFLGVLKSLLYLNWVLIYSFFSYYNKNNIFYKDKPFFYILCSFFKKTIYSYRTKYNSIIVPYVIEKKSKLLLKHNNYLYIFIYDIISILLFIIYLYYKYFF